MEDRCPTSARTSRRAACRSPSAPKHASSAVNSRNRNISSWERWNAKGWRVPRCARAGMAIGIVCPPIIERRPPTPWGGARPGTAGATTSPVNQTRALAGDSERRRLKGPKDSLATDSWHLPAGAERTSFPEYWPIGATSGGAGVNRKALKQHDLIWLPTLDTFRTFIAQNGSWWNQ